MDIPAMKSNLMTPLNNNPAGPRHAGLLNDGLTGLGALPRIAQRLLAALAQGREMEQRV